MPNFMLFRHVHRDHVRAADNLQVLARGISQGRAAGFVAALGFTAGILFHTTLAALGVAAVLRSSPVAFQILKLAGAAYLVWIGIRRCAARDSRMRMRARRSRSARSSGRA